MIAACFHGSDVVLEVRAHHGGEQPGADDVVRLRAQVDRAQTRSQRSSSRSQPPAICGESDDVAQVSMTSGSPMKPPGSPRWSSVKPAGTSLLGSTGSSASVGTSGSS